MHKSGRLRGEVIKYSDGVGGSIWYPMSDDESAGIVFDFSMVDIDDMIELLKILKNAEPDIFEYGEEEIDDNQNLNL
jgi:hypothetical protein